MVIVLSLLEVLKVVLLTETWIKWYFANNIFKCIFFKGKFYFDSNLTDPFTKDSN